ncbi:Hypothetical protein Bdt_3008 [Bdellovibrio bacteriovorus str. Tiberius]|uniref:Uncharacterized protein n=1 Tax=Bdellovibrio bacteriovorus str. Tiberius TaxID=1069642 RepID=K7YYA5_BDEBC|nr:Hypothetical protein Bdt_3008 [Bdellovibrio bacteriovorus str. Tiberius]
MFMKYAQIQGKHTYDKGDETCVKPPEVSKRE